MIVNLRRLTGLLILHCLLLFDVNSSCHSNAAAMPANVSDTKGDTSVIPSPISDLRNAIAAKLC